MSADNGVDVSSSTKKPKKRKHGVDVETQPARKRRKDAQPNGEEERPSSTSINAETPTEHGEVNGNTVERDPPADTSAAEARAKEAKRKRKEKKGSAHVAGHSRRITNVGRQRLRRG